MINLRYHVVSITAVFLALGLGLTMGSTFLDRATVDSLNTQLQSLENELGRNDERIGELESALEAARADDEQFAEQGLAPLLDGELTDVPVIVFSVRGTDSNLIDRSVAALNAAGADLAGTWTVTERFALDDESERRDLATVLDIETDLESRLRREAMQSLASVLLDRLSPVTPPRVDPDATSGTTDETTGTTDDTTGTTDDTTGTTETPGDDEVQTDAAAPDEPALLSALVNAGFLEYQPLGDGDGERVLPVDDARVVLITDADADLTPEQFVIPMLEDLTLDGPAAVVLGTGIAEDADPATRGAVVDSVRADPDLSNRLSTIDDLDVFEGWAALVLAVAGLDDGQLSHYGKADSASRLLPAPDGST